MDRIPIICVVGWHNSGKTTFVERLIVELRCRGLHVATIKHTRRGFEMDHAGTDTWRYAKAGSDVVSISGPDLTVVIERRSKELSLLDLIRRMPPHIDLIIAEGYKTEPFPKIEVVRSGIGEGRCTSPGDRVLAVVGDATALAAYSADKQRPRCFASDDVAAVADMLEDCGLITRGTVCSDFA